MSGTAATVPPVERLAAPLAGADLASLAEVVADCVAGGASVSFMPPFGPEEALDWWRGLLPAIAAGEILLLAARDGDGRIAGTVQLHLKTPPNQPHRAEIAKLLVHRRARGRGMAAALIRAAEAAAGACGRRLLTFDTATGSAGERLYRRLGFVAIGVIPGYALYPDGAPCDTTVFYKWLEPPAGPAHPA